MQKIRLGETTPALAVIPFTSVLHTDVTSRITGATLANAAITVKIKKGGIAAAIAGGAGAFTAVDDANAPGDREYLPAVAEQFLGICTFIFTGANMEPRECPVMFVPEDPYRPSYYGSVIAGTLTTIAFSTDRAEADVNHWQDALVEFLTGSNAGAVKPIGAFTVAGGIIGLKAGYALPNAPVATDRFRIITR